MNVSQLFIMELTGVSETLLLTLYARYLETKRGDGIIKDEKSIEIVEAINYDFSKFDDGGTRFIVAVRTEILDQAVEQFLEEHPNATIINLGAGLCTRFFRLDNGIIKWFEVDLEQVKPFWDKLIGGTDRHQYIACSVLDFSWMDVIQDNLGACHNQPILFIAEGLLMYFPEAEVKRVLLEIKHRFPCGDMFIDATGSLLSSNTQRHPTVSKTSAIVRWGTNNLKEIEKWGNGISLLKQWYYIDRHQDKMGWRRFLAYVPLLRETGKIGHIKFSPYP